MSSSSGNAGPRILAHRGASARARENTTEAFRLATELGADGVELDVRRTADGVLVVHHDLSVEDIGLIPKVTMADLRRSAPWIPTFEEALDACTGVVNVEIKSSPAEPEYDSRHEIADDVAAVLVALNRAGTSLEFVVSSFNPLTIGRVKEVAPELRTGWLIMPTFDAIEAVELVTSHGHQALHPPLWSLGELGDAVLDEVVGAAHARGVAISVWTVDDPSTMRRMAEAGVDSIITNVPDIAVSALRP